MNAKFVIRSDRVETISNINKSTSCKVQKAKLKADDGTIMDVATKAYTYFRESEINILAQLQHKNVIKFIGAVTKDDKTLILVMEYAPNGNLYDYLMNQNKQLSFDHSLEWAKHCSNAVAYLHSKRIIHRDIKSPNFLLIAATEENDLSVLKLCDFGISHQSKNSTTTTWATAGGLSYRWATPDVLAASELSCSIKSDVYSLAVVIWELFTGEKPYGEITNDFKIQEQIINGNTLEVESIQSQVVCKILQMCWRGQKSERPSSKRVVEMLNEIIDDDVEPDSAQPHGSLRKALHSRSATPPAQWCGQYFPDGGSEVPDGGARRAKPALENLPATFSSLNLTHDVEPDSRPDYAQPPAPFKEVAKGLESLAATFSSIRLTHESVQPFTPRNVQPRSQESFVAKLSTGPTHESVQLSMVLPFTPRNSQPRSRQRTVTDSELQELTCHLGKHWREFGRILGYKQPEIDVFDINNTTNVKDAMYDMLYSWKSKRGSEATVGNLVNHLDNFEHINPEDYQFLIDDSKKE